MHLRFVLVDARPTARAALREVVEEQWGWTVAGEAVDGFEAIRVARNEGADVLLVDAAVEGLDLKALFDLVDPEVGPLVVGLLDFPHQHVAARGVAVMKGAPPDHVRNVILGSLKKHAESRQQLTDEGDR
ncbi:MAG: hypothetical protein GEU71_04410 [Actinobacteria bacterium]|jgi:DNA-binding NarL/FixJ family response regulator|nr:hypothetical protein [Actinomycetota bacterium]